MRTTESGRARARNRANMLGGSPNCPGESPQHQTLYSSPSHFAGGEGRERRMSSTGKLPMHSKSQKHRRDWLRGLVRKMITDGGNRKVRPIRFEPLEGRQLMAADFFSSAAWYANYGPAQDDHSWMYYSSYQAGDSSSLVAEGEEEGEGEDAANLVEFAKALAQAGVRFYGADWCPLCTEQKELFKDGKNYLPFIEMTNPDRTRNATAIAEGVEVYPTWEFADGTRVTGVQSLADLATLAGVAIPTGSNPSVVDIPNQTVLNGSPLHVPVDAYDPNGGPLTITVTSSNPSVISADMITETKSLRLVVNGYGEMVFRLFENEAPRPVQRIEQLVNSGFYDQSASNKIIFHRVIDTFMIQTGDPTGTGSGGSTLGKFDDQFNFNLQHNRSGILSYAKSGDDTNDSQFFITEGATRHLDFNHSIFGQLIEGDAVREGISRTTTNSSDRPLNEISIREAEIFNDLQNGLIRLKALATSGTSTITVTVTNANGNVVTKQFTATAGADTANGGPFLNDITVPSQIPAGQPTSLQLVGNDVEGDGIYYDAVKQGSVDYTFTVDHDTGLVTITPPANYTGELQILVAVRAKSGTPTTSDTWDSQLVTYNVVNAGAIAPTSVALDPTSDTGPSNSDGYTSASSMTFIVSGTVAGATVELRVGSTVVGSAVATGSTTSITTTQISQMGQGTRNVTATQTLNGETSGASPAFAVTYDTDAPEAINVNQLPGFAKLNTLLTFDLSHSEESQGLRYSFETAPTGMNVDPTTGVITWTPTAAQEGVHTVKLVLTDRAGNAKTQSFEIHVANEALVSVRLVPYDANGNELTTILQGQEFYLRVIVTDLRTAGNGNRDGVFSAYMDIQYDPNIFELVGESPIEYGPTFGNGQFTPNLSTPGLIDELGAFSSFTAGPGRAPQVVAAIAMRAKASGQGNFSANPAETPRHGMAIFNVYGLIPDDLVQFIPNNIAIGQDFVVNNDTFNFNEDTHNNVLDVLTNDTIVSGSGVVLTIQSVGTTSKGGVVSIAQDGKTLIYTPAANFFGQETFTYTAKDQSGDVGTATVTVQVNPVNDNPVAMPDTFTHVTPNSQNTFLDVLANDTMGPDTGETLVVTSVGTPSQGGTVTVASAGTGVVYTPKAGFSGTETFTYTISDGLGGTSSSTVTVVVGTGATPPTIVNDSYSISEDAPASEYDVLANDTPAASGDTLTIISVTAPNGTASITSNGTRITYAPKANYNGTELVVYTARSSNGGVATGTITYNITAVNDPPNAVDDALDVLSQPNQKVDVLANDTNVDSGETLTITSVTQPASGQGTVQIAADGKSLIYSAPNTSFTGTVTFTYTVSDGTLTDTANVTLRVLDFTPRNVGVVLDSRLQGLPITATYMSSVSNSSTPTTVPVVRTANGAMVTGVGPGEVRFTISNVPFLNGSAQTVTVRTEASDGDSLTTPFPVGTVAAQYVNLRSFMGQSLGAGLTTAVSPNEPAHWYETKGNWNGYSNVSVVMNSAGTGVTVKATNPSNQPVEKALQLTDSKVQLQAQEGAAKMIRLRGTPAQIFGSTPAAQSDGLTGEGEGSDMSPQSVDSAIQDLTSPVPIEDLDAIAQSSVSNGYRRGFRTR